MLSFFLTVITAIVTADLLWWWRADRFLRPLRRARLWRGLLAAFMGGQLALVFVLLFGRLLSPNLPSALPGVLTAFAYLWHLLALPAIVITWLLVGIGTGIARGIRWLRGPSETSAAVTEPTLTVPFASRRQFLGAVAAAAPPLLTTATVGVSMARLDEFRVRPITVDVPNLPPELDGLRIAHVSDIHVGRFTNGRTLKRIVQATNQLDADLVLLTGDLINNSLTDLSDGLEAVANMQSRHGSFLCVGNHDLMDDPREFVRRTKVRVPLLVGESQTLTVNGYPLQLLGLPWTRGQGAIESAVRDVATLRQPVAFPVLLAHHPHAFDAAAASGIPLTLSGHTHGGQLMLSDTVGFGPMFYKYWSGLYQKPAGRHRAALVVSNGVGNWFPLRTHAPAEIIDLRLRRVS